MANEYEDGYENDDVMNEVTDEKFMDVMKDKPEPKEERGTSEAIGVSKEIKDLIAKSNLPLLEKIEQLTKQSKAITEQTLKNAGDLREGKRDDALRKVGRDMDDVVNDEEIREVFFEMGKPQVRTAVEKKMNDYWDKKKRSLSPKDASDLLLHEHLMKVRKNAGNSANMRKARLFKHDGVKPFAGKAIDFGQEGSDKEYMREVVETNINY